MKALNIQVTSINIGDQFTAGIQYDDGITMITKRYTNQEQFLADLEKVYELKPEEIEGGEDVEDQGAIEAPAA